MDSTDSENAKRALSPIAARGSALTKEFSASLVQLFTLTPAQRGGRSARKGYEFQDYWIAYRLISSLSDNDDLVSARIEGVEDLDLFVRREESFVEQYIQVKSKEEGAGNWTIASLEQEKVFSRFFRLFKDFQEAARDEERGIEFVVVVEGDLAKPVQQIQHNGGRELFPILVASQMRAISGAYESETRRIQDFFESAARELLDGASAKYKSDLSTIAAEMAGRILLGAPEIEQALLDVAVFTAKALKEFTSVLKFHSRAPGVASLRDVAITRIMQSADVAVADANKAFDRLLSRIVEESAKPFPTPVDRNLLISWLGLAPKPSLRVKPDLVSDYVHRSEFANTFSTIVDDNVLVALYGLSRIGKSQFASRYIESSVYQQRYLWFTFSGQADDSKRLTEDIGLFVGKIASVWQIAEDEATNIGRQSFLERLGKLQIEEVLIVLDDSHKCADPSLFAALQTALRNWKNSKLLLLSEGKIQGVETIGAKQVRLPGLSPAEALQFIALQGITPRGQDVLFEIVALTIKFDGHPLMLKAICQGLPPRPTSADVKRVSDSLPSVMPAKVFLGELSNQLFFRLLHTSEQRYLLSRLALLPGRFDWRMAEAVAGVEPKVIVTRADWQYMKSVVLDEVDAERCLIPQLLKQIAQDNLPSDLQKKKVLVAAAHKQLKPGGSVSVQFVDFQTAILTLIFGEAYTQAASFFVVSFPRLFGFAQFSDLQLLFMVLNGEPVLAKISSPLLRWKLLSGEVAMRAQDPVAVGDKRVPLLLNRLRSLEHKLNGDWRFQSTIATLILLIRSRRMFGPNSSPPTVKAVRKVFASAKHTFRILLRNHAVGGMSLQLKFFKFAAGFCRVDDLNLLKDILLAQRAAGERTLTDNVISEIYAAFGVNREGAGPKRAMLVEHAFLYSAANFSGAYFASKYALALLIHERKEDYASARMILETLLANKEFSRLLTDRAVVAIGDTYCAEKNYAASATWYARALKGHHTRGIRGHIQGRWIDTLALSGDSTGAFAATISILRKRGPRLTAAEKARLYARLAYIASQNREMTKAAIACLGVRRAAVKANSDELHYLCLYMAGWVLGAIEFKEDALIPQSALQIRDIFALSESIDSKAIEESKTNDTLRIKSYIQISAIFELNEKYKRALALLYKAKTQIPLEPQPDERTVAFLVNSRVTRLQLALGRASDASALFIDVIAYQLTFKNAPPEAVGLLCCDFLKPVTRSITDEQLQVFAEGVTQRCAAWPQVRAGIQLWYARQLFERLLVQKAKVVLRQSEDTARGAKAYHILRIALAEKLFTRTFQIYSVARSDWGMDLIAATTELGQDDVPDEARRLFAKQLKELCEGNPQNLQGINSVFVELHQVYKDHPFEVATLAVWKASRDVGVPDQTLLPLREFLRIKAAFLTFS